MGEVGRRGLTVAMAVAALFYSSFFADPGGVLGPLRAAGTYLDRGVDAGTHAHPWHFYLGILAYSSSGGLTWTEGVVLALAAVGAVTAWAPPRASDLSRESRSFWMRFLTCNAVIATAIFSAIPYKTPWNLLPFYAGVIVVAGIGFSTIVQATSSRVARGALTAALVIASGHLGWQAWRASVTYASDPRNPYVYAQTVPDAVRMATRIRELAAVHPDGARMQVSVIAPPHEQWPLPWYLRTMPHVGYWTAAGDALALQAPVIVASTDQTDSPRPRPRRRLRVGVLRPQARGAPDALHRARAVGALPGTRREGCSGHASPAEAQLKRTGAPRSLR